MAGNIPPSSGIRVPAAHLHWLVARLFEKAGVVVRDAEVIARLLVKTDLRGVFSHGTRTTPGYVRMMLDGRLNPRPTLSVVCQTRTTQVIDGDGGLGHLPCYQGARWAAATAKAYGTAAVTTRNHFHFGGASKYALPALEHDCIGLAVSSHRYELSAQTPIRQVNGASPICLAIPAGVQPPLVLDMGANMLSWDEELFSRMPFAFFKELGLGAVNRALGGILPGIYQPQFQSPHSPWEANQGSFIAMFDVACFMPVDQFKEEMDRFIAAARQMRPFPGFSQAELPGGLEWQRRQQYTREGIPISPEHQHSLENLAAELEVETPFAGFEHTRFQSPHRQ